MGFASKHGYLELVWQVLEEPGVRPDSSNGDPLGGVTHEDLADHVQALLGQVEIAGEAILHAHDSLRK